MNVTEVRKRPPSVGCVPRAKATSIHQHLHLLHPSSPVHSSTMHGHFRARQRDGYGDGDVINVDAGVRTGRLTLEARRKT